MAATWHVLEMELSPRRLTRKSIEQKANILLLEYEIRFGAIRKPPVPIEEIIELFLGFHVEFDDLVRKHGAGTLGAVSIRTRTITIDESLDPEDDPTKVGRCHFTLAHEART